MSSSVGEPGALAGPSPGPRDLTEVGTSASVATTTGAVAQTTPPAPGVGAGASSASAAAGPELSEKQRQQLQLVQLCFYEHEFGILLDDDEDNDDGADAVGAVASAGDGVEAALGTFDPVAFVRGKVHYGVALEDLRKDLAFYMEHVKGRITRHVNSDMHTAFVEVSGRLSGMESELQYLERPLAASIKKVSAACEELAGMADAVDAKVGNAKDVEEERQFDISFLSGLLLYENTAATIEEDLAPRLTAKPIAPAPATVLPNSGAALVSRPVLEGLEAVGQSASRLRALAAALPALPQREEERAELTALAGEARTAVLQLLRRVLVDTCAVLFSCPEAPSAAASLKEVACMYARMHARDEFCTTFREGVLGPFLDRIFPWKAATQARQSTEETLRLLELLERELRCSITPLFPMLRASFADEPLHPASAILWPVLCEVLVKKLVTLYEVGIPDAFHRKYRAAYRLLALAEECCATPGELAVLRQSPDVAMWNHKWNTEAYATMRLTEMARALEPALAVYKGAPTGSATSTANTSAMTNGGAATASGAVRMQLEVFRLLHEQLLRLFSPDVFLAPCLPKYLRQVPVSVQQVCRAVLDCAARAGSSAGDAAVVPFLPPLLADAAALARSATQGGPLHAQMTGAATAAVSTAAPAVTTAVEGVLALVAERVCAETAAAARRRMTSRLEEESLAALQNLKSVRSAYAHTKKPFPTAPSWYVASVTEPIARFARDAAVSGVEAAGVSSMVAAVVDTIAEHFTALARETLLTARKTEESWEKLRRKKDSTVAAAGGAGGVMGGSAVAVSGARPTPETATDRDKMMLQLYIDAKALEDSTREVVGAAPGRSPAMQALFMLLQRAEWILGASIPEPPEIEEV